MNYPISEIDGISAAAAQKLKSVGIRTTEKLLEAAGTVRARRKLSAATGLNEQQLLEWANLADYMRIKGMGKGRAKLIRLVGVNTVREFIHRNPERLAQAMKEANASQKLVRALPSGASVKTLMDRARKLPLKITY